MTPFSFSMHLRAQSRAELCRMREHMAGLSRSLDNTCRRAAVSQCVHDSCKMSLTTAHTMLCTTFYTLKAILLRPGKYRCSDTKVHQSQGCYRAPHKCTQPPAQFQRRVLCFITQYGSARVHYACAQLHLLRLQQSIPVHTTNVKSACKASFEEEKHERKMQIYSTQIKQENCKGV